MQRQFPLMILGFDASSLTVGLDHFSASVMYREQLHVWHFSLYVLSQKLSGLSGEILVSPALVLRGTVNTSFNENTGVSEVNRCDSQGT